MPTVAELEQQIEAAKIAEKQAQREAVERQARADRGMRGTEHQVGQEVRALRDKVDKAIAAKAPAARPAPQTRALARRFLHRGLAEDFTEYHLLEQLAAGDPTWGVLHGLNGTAGQLMSRGGVIHETLIAAIDELEVRTWAALIARAQFVAGEVES